MATHNRDDYVAAMASAAIKTLLWSELDDCDTPLSQNYSQTDICQETYAELMDDIDGFSHENWNVLQDFEAAQVGHDFILTRNGHGAGFWDGDYPEDIGTLLTASAKTYGTLGLFVGHNGDLYGHN